MIEINKEYGYMTKIKNMIPQGIKYLFRQFSHYGHQIFLVGGCTRDILLGKKPHDWDMCTSATPQQMLDLAYYNNRLRPEHLIKVIPTGVKHNTITFSVNKECYEITTFRNGIIYVNNNEICTGSLTEDLSFRDFTMNAIAYNPYQGFIDPFNGIDDIQNHIIRCVGNPEERFNEDGLRILRCMRFAAQLGFEIDSETFDAANKLSKNLKNISYERITSELCKGLKSQHPDYMINNILLQVIPEMETMKNCQQNNPYHIFDVWNHTICAVNNEKSENIIIRLALLFHDIGKPECMTTDNKGIQHFYGHEKVSAEMTKEIMKRMRFDNNTINKVIELIRYHDVDIKDNKKSVKHWLYRLGEEQLQNLLQVKQCDIKAQNPEYAQTRLNKINCIKLILEQIIANHDCFTIKDLAINGYDLIHIGIPEGKSIGKILNKLLSMVINEKIKNTREVLLKTVEEMKGDMI